MCIHKTYTQRNTSTYIRLGLPLAVHTVSYALFLACKESTFSQSAAIPFCPKIYRRTKVSYFWKERVRTYQLRDFFFERKSDLRHWFCAGFPWSNNGLNKEHYGVSIRALLKTSLTYISKDINTDPESKFPRCFNFVGSLDVGCEEDEPIFVSSSPWTWKRPRRKICNMQRNLLRSLQHSQAGFLF